MNEVKEFLFQIFIALFILSLLLNVVGVCAIHEYVKCKDAASEQRE